MKTLFLLLVVTLASTACKKDADNVKPQGTAGAVIGTYTLSSFRYQTQDDELNIPTLPVVQNGKKTYYGTVKLTESTDPNKAQMTLQLTFDSKALDAIDFEEIDVEKNGSRYELVYDGETLATISGNTLKFDVQTQEARMAFTASR
ncbi:hypothetical protein [Spirosoma fluminis]